MFYLNLRRKKENIRIVRMLRLYVRTRVNIADHYVIANFSIYKIFLS